jgi:uncharacterized phage-associated protein
MRSAFDVAVFFLKKVDRANDDAITNLKLQKLTYYVQAWSLVLRRKPFFQESIQAWEHGPVVPAVYHHYSCYGKSGIPEPAELLPDFGLDELEVVESVWEVYGGLTAVRLSQLTHAEDPWNVARGNLSPSEQSQAEISSEVMKAYYSDFIDAEPLQRYARIGFMVTQINKVSQMQRKPVPSVEEHVTRLRSASFPPRSKGQLERAKRALNSLRDRKQEDLESWADRLAQDVASITD